VSVDSTHVIRTWSDQEHFGFTLLADFWPHGGVAKLYGVFDENIGVARRGTFIIDKAGFVRLECVKTPFPRPRHRRSNQKCSPNLA